MSSIQERLAARAAAAVERHGDQNEIEERKGGDYTPPHAGKAKARLVGYIETGPQKDAKYPEKKPGNKFQLVFQLYGKNADGQEWVRNDGNPMTITTRKFSVSRNEKAHAVKIFRQMAPKRDAAHFMELLGRAFWVEIEHNVQPAKEQGKPDVVFANIIEAGLKPAVKEVLDDDDNVVGYRELAVPEPKDSDFVLLEWDVPSKEDFEKLTEGQKKTLRAATGFKGGAWEALVGGGNPAATDAPDEPDEQEEKEEAAPANENKVQTSAQVDESDLPAL
ncbi:hypothetical protein BN110_033 [Yersinia phage phiR8-01]|uniref:Uncharacterized protein n=1 Tax=Yersinia phage phiR8-01 TaxID=1206556 RepID=I7LGX0_9CAUD|nr:hypothetical protein HOT05_gp23 [Yersinia phage phiR8-01]CCI88404.2 hypothetical protein BN110_033 [Yersinia phage phiR8-01]